MSEPNTKPLPVLRVDCLQQIQRYRLTRNPTNASESCLEILRRAVDNDLEALEALVTISQVVLSEMCPPDLQDRQNALETKSLSRLRQRLHKKDKPFRATSFPQYVKFVRLTVRSVAYHMRRGEPGVASLEELGETRGFEPVAPNPVATDVERAEGVMIFHQLLMLLNDPLEREVIRRRYGYGEKPDEIVESLRSEWPELTKAQVYRATEHALRHLRNHPEVRALEVSL